MSFTTIKVGDKVFEKSSKEVGIVTAIQDEHVTMDTLDNRSIYTHLSKVIKVDHVKELMEEIKKEDALEIEIKYFNENLEKVNKITQGDWIDLRSSKDVSIKKGEFALIPLGVAMKLPEGYEAVVAPRSSTFKNFGVIETNSIGVIDNSYSGNDDQWFFPAYALRDTEIKFNDRICQFRIQKRMPEILFTEKEYLEGENRGGHGSTGVK